MNIDQAKAVVRSHEGLVADGHLEGILSNMDADVVILAPESPLVGGLEAVRGLYAGLLAMGSWDFGHDYVAASEGGDFVFLHGVARGSMTSPEGEATAMSNNFMITMRRDAEGRFRFWRVAFAPSGE